MKRLCVLLAVLLGLGACGVGVAEETSAVTTTETATTEAPTTHVEIRIDESDPYSYVVKAYYEFVQNFGLYYGNESQCMNLVQGFEMQPHMGFEDIDHYILPGVVLYYALYDINGDGVEELLLSVDGIQLFEIYTIRNGIAIQQMQLPTAHNKLSICTNGTVVVSHDRKGHFADIYYQFKDGLLQYCTTIGGERNYANLDDDHVNYHQFHEETWGYDDRVRISEKEYLRIKNLYDDGQEIALDWQPLWTY